MSEIKIIRQEDHLLYPEVLFNRPINRLKTPKISLLGGQNSHFKSLSVVYEVINALGLDNQLILPLNLKSLDLFGGQVAYFEPAVKSSKFSNTDQIIELVMAGNLSIIGFDLALTSQTQILLERILGLVKTPIILTNEAVKLFKINPNPARAGEIVFFVDTAALIKLAGYLSLPIELKAGRGIYNKINVIIAVANKLNVRIINYDTSQLLVYDVAAPDEIGLVAFENADLYQLSPIIAGVCAGLVADWRGQLGHFKAKVLTAGYLVKKLTEHGFLENGNNMASGLQQLVKAETNRL